MTTFAYELASVLQRQDQARPRDPEGPYAMPWYLVIGEPGHGRTTAIKALNLSWPHGDTPIDLQLPTPQCSYWMPEKAVFIEPGPAVLGPNRQQGLLAELCEELKTKRPREPVDGLLLIVSAQYLADSTDEAVQTYATGLRRYVIEVMQALAADIPVYVVVSSYDSLWGFGDAFQWTAERRDEEPWGFSLRPNVGASDTPEYVRQELEGLSARIEAMCFAKLSSEDPWDGRTRAFQHLIESRDLLHKLGSFMQEITMGNAFERAPWVRALAIGSGIPGTGQRLRHGEAKFAAMGLYAPQQSGTPQPGGMPLHAMLDNVLLPERDIVPTRVRWRDDMAVMALIGFGVLAWVTAIVSTFVR
jgi:type VI protein secretion system component VasK